MKNKFSKFINLQGKYLTSLLIVLFFAVGQMWGAASSVIPSSPDYKDISTVATSGTYTFTCSSANITGAADATSSWIGWYSTQSSFKEYDKSGSATCMGSQTKIPNLKYDKVYFYVTNCTSFEVQAWGNGDNRHVNYSYQATDAASPTADSFTSANNTTCASSGEIALDASKSYTIIVWNDASEEIGVTYMVFNTSTSGGGETPSATTYSVTYDCDNADSGCPDNVASATALPDPLPSAPVKDGYTFDGWFTNSGKTDAAVAGATLSANVTLYAKWTASGSAPSVTCPESGSLFKMEVLKVCTCSIASGSTYAIEDGENYSVESGSIEFYNKNSSTKAMLSKNQSSLIQWNWNTSDVTFHVTLDCALEVGDTIKYTGNQTLNDVYLNETYSTKGTSADSTLKSGWYVVKSGDRFVGDKSFYMWRSGSTTYIRTIEVVRPAPVVNYTVTYALNGGSGTTPTESAKAAGAKFNLHNGTTDITAPSGKVFDKWKDQDNNVYAGGAQYTMPAKNVTLTAQWKDAGTLGADATLSALSVAGCTLNETFDPETTEYTISLPFYASMPAVSDVTATKNDAKAKTPEVSIYGNVITVVGKAEDNTTTKTYTITVSIAAAPAASSSLNLEQNVLDNGKSWDVVAALAAANIVVDGTNGLDSLNDAAGKTARNYGFLGLKFNQATNIIRLVVPASNVLNVKFGNIATAINVKINDVDQTSIATKTNGTSTVYHLDAADGVREVIFNLGTAKKTVTLQQVKIGADVDAITLPWKVTYTVGSNGTCAKASEVWTGTALTLPAVTANQGYTFDGWSDGTNTFAAGASYTPTKNDTLVAQYSMAEDNRLASLEFNGVAVAGFSPDQNLYYMTVPYSISVPQITKAVPVDATNTTATIQETYWDDVNKYYVAQAYTTTASNAHKYYQVRFTMEPKKGVEIIKVVVPAGTHNDTEATGYFGGTGDTKNEGSSLKIGSSCYAGVVLPTGKTFQEGDVINIHTSVVSTSGGSVIKIYADKEAETLLYNTETIGGTTAGDNIFVLPAAVNNKSSLYVVRTSDNSWNASIDFISVERCMASFIESFEIENVDLTMNGTAITATVPSAFDVTALTPTIKAWANGGATVTPTGAQDFTDPVDYTVSSIYGEQTVYTVTITKVVPSAEPVITAQPQGANYLEGASIAALEVVATGEALTYQWYLGANAIDGATEATYTPTVSAIGSYVYHCVVTNTEAGHPATSLASSNATITISDDPAAIKLIAANGDINTTDFITAVSKGTVNYGGADHNCATFGSTASTAVGASGLNKFIIYNAKTDQTKIKFVLYNTQNSAQKLVLQKLAEGGDAMEEIEIDVPSKEEFTTEYYTYTSSANRTMYAFVKNTGIKVLQVKVIDNGAPLKQFGEVGYSINFNQGRLFLNSGTDGAYDGLTYNAASNYAPLTNSGLSITKSKAYSFNVPAAATMTVTAANNAKYYITQSTTGTDNETAVAEARSFDLTAGTWYLRVDGSNLSVTNIAFAAPTCNLAISTQPASNTNFGAGDMTATVVAASSTDGASLAYQWYNASDDSEVAGASAATLTTTVEGMYYVIVTASKSGYQDKAVQSNTIELGRRDLTIATLSALSYGGTAIALEADKYEYRVDLPEGTTEVPVLAATATQAGYGATAVPTDAAAFDNYEAISTVLVTAENGTTTQTYTVHFYVDHQILALVDVTGNMTWDFSKAQSGTTAGSNMCNEAIFANVDGINNNDDFESDNLMVTANKFSSGKLQASMIKFHTTVDGMIKVVFSNTGSKSSDRYLTVNGRKTDKGSKNQTAVIYTGFVYAGDVVLGVVEGDGNMLNFTSVEFKATVDYPRTVNPSYLGTLCWTNNAVLGGATLYEFAGKNENNYLVFDEVAENRLEAGKPYIFMPDNGNTQIKVYNTDNEPALTTDQDPVNNMYGTITGKTLVPGQDDNMYYFSASHIWAVKDFTVSINIPAYYCYVNYQAVLNGASAPTQAPGRRRVTMGVQGEQVATGMENINASEQPMKVMIDGQLFILRGEKMFNANGQLVK